MVPDSLLRTVAPTLEPIDLRTAKHQCNLDPDDTAFDPWFQSGDGDVGAIAAARELVEIDTSLVLMNQTFQWRLSRWPCGSVLELPLHPLRSITSIVSVDTAGDSQTWGTSNYEALRSRHRSYILKPDNSTDWPTLSSTKELPITITFVAGFPDPATDTTDALKRAKVPAAAKKAMLLLVAHWFKNREAVLTGTISKDIEFSYTALTNALRPATYP